MDAVTRVVPSPMEFATLEMLDAHDFMDKVQVPRSSGPTRFSMSQRVKMLAEAFAKLAIEKARG